jgi:hypothetical protein
VGAALTQSSRGVHQVRLTRNYTASEQEIEFGRRYLEVVFARLFDSRPAEGPWCVSGSEDFKRSVSARSTHVQSHYLVNAGRGDLLDEAAWHSARFLETLYHTRSFHDGFGQPPSLVSMPDDRYWLLAGFAHGVPHNAVGQLSLDTWDAMLQALVKSVWIDFLAWCVGLSNLPTPIREVVPSAVNAFCTRFVALEQQLEDSWFDTALREDLRTMLTQPIGTVSLPEFDEIVRDILAEYPNDRVRKLAPYGVIRQEVLEYALGEALEALTEFPFDEWVQRYFAEGQRRARMEIDASQALLDLLIQREYEVAIPLRGTLPKPLAAPAHRMEVTSRPPEAGGQAEREQTIYAYVRGILARGPRAAIANAKRTAELLLAAPAVRFGFGIQIQTRGQAYFRTTESAEWLMSGETHGLPVAAMAEHWATTLQIWNDLLQATDPLGTRIHDAIVSLNKGNSAYDATDRLQAHWRVFEIIIGAPGDIRSRGHLLPLYFVHDSFRTMRGPDKLTFVNDRSTILKRQFGGLINFRNKAIDHRETVRPDDSVLTYWATMGASLAQEVVSAAVVGWHHGARTRDALWDRLRTAYDKLGVKLA